MKRNYGKSVGRLKPLQAVVLLLVIATWIPVGIEAQGPHIETPRSVIINEIYSGNEPWVELVNPTSEDVDLHGWKIQMLEDGEWETIHLIDADTIEEWGSGEEYMVFELEDGLDYDNIEIRLVDSEDDEIDGIGYSSLDCDHSLARYRQETGIPVDRDMLDDWYVSSIMTKGYENDSVIP